tara:strand:- start:17180 stop:17362 length:183 start_codon:yes stop_codon:yes gene_type:complete
MNGEFWCCCCCITYYTLNCIVFGGSLIKEFFEERRERNSQIRYNMVLSTIQEEYEENITE